VLFSARSTSLKGEGLNAAQDMDETTVSDKISSGANDKRSYDCGPSLPSLDQNVPTSASDSPEAVTESMLFRMSGFRPLDKRELSAANALIATRQRRHRRRQLRWYAAVLTMTVGTLAVASAILFLTP
jgi:hypothetical protein